MDEISSKKNFGGVIVRWLGEKEVRLQTFFNKRVSISFIANIEWAKEPFSKTIYLIGEWYALRRGTVAILIYNFFLVACERI